ncbi:MAG: VOC family protein [Saprospiraceae bacterium]
MNALNPYLKFNGNCQEAFNHYQSVFGGAFANPMRFKDVPAEFEMPAEEAEKIMHIALPMNNGSVLMGCDVPASMGVAKVGDNIDISISTESKEEADRLFNGLSAGGQVMMPMSDTFWGAYFGMCTDQFGIHWMVSYDQNYV